MAIVRETYEKYLKAAWVLTLTGGCTLGAVLIAYMAYQTSLESVAKSLIQAHGHLQLFGWVGLFIMGVAVHVLPRFKNTQLNDRRIADHAFWLMLLGVSLRFIAQPFAADVELAGWLVVSSGVLELIAVAAFGYMIVKTMASSPNPPQDFDRFVLASIVWFGISAVMNLGLVLAMVFSGSEELPEVYNPAFIHVQIYGFIMMMIFGISLRTLPVFMGLHSVKQGQWQRSFWLLNAGIALRLVSDPFNEVSQLARVLYAVSAILELVAVLAFIDAINIFKKPEIDMSDLDLDRSYEKFIKAGYFWLTVAILSGSSFVLFEAITGNSAGHALIGAYRHAITVGFINMMIFGYATRIIPVFTGADLYKPSWVSAAFYLVNIGNTLRVFFQPFAVLTGIGPGFFFMGISGTLETTALLLMATVIWKTINNSHLQYGSEPSASEPAETTTTTTATSTIAS